MLEASQSLLDRSHGRSTWKWKTWLAAALLLMSSISILFAWKYGSASKVLVPHVDNFRASDGKEESQCHWANINYLGMAYDMAQGMPQPWNSKTMKGDIGDPGWKVRRVLEPFADSECHPSGADVIKAEESAAAVEVSQIATGYELQMKLKEEFHTEASAYIEDSGAGFAFTQSSEFQFVDQKSKQSRFILSTLVYNIYRAVVKAGNLRLSQEFRNAVDRLPTGAEDIADAYGQFIDDFGTDVPVDVTMGARVSSVLQFDTDELNDALREGLNLHAEAKANFLLAHFGADGGVSSEAHGHFFSRNMRVKKFGVCLGSHGLCPPDVTKTQWHRGAVHDPMPLKVRFVSILSFLNNDHFGADSHITEKRDRLAKRLIDKYCAGKHTCDVIVPELYSMEVPEVPNPDPNLLHRVSAAVSLQGSLYVVRSESCNVVWRHNRWEYWGHTYGRCLEFLYKLNYHRTSPWERVSITLPDRGGFILAASSQRLYLVGGGSDRRRRRMNHLVLDIHRGVYEIDPVPGNPSMTLIGNIEQARYGAAAIVMDEKVLYVIGGTRDFPPSSLDSVELFHLDTNNVQWGPFLNSPRCWPAVAESGDIIFVSGGYTVNYPGYVTKSVEYLNVKHGQWAYLEATLGIPRAGAGLVFSQGQLLVFGGLTWNRNLRTFQSLEDVEVLCATNCTNMSSQALALRKQVGNKLMSERKAWLAAVKIQNNEYHSDQIYLVGGLQDPSDFVASGRIEMWSVPKFDAK